MITNNESVFRPLQQLLPYQKRWVDDYARWKFGLMARQVGKDFAAAFEGMADCALAEAEGRKIDWLIAAPSERQSLESLQKWKEWAEVFKIALVDEEYLREAGGESLLRSATITFPHGSRVIAVPGKPETVRGFSANVLLTEFAFFERPEATWAAMIPSVTNALRGLKKVRLITTPNGIGNMAHDIWVKNRKTISQGTISEGRISESVNRGMSESTGETKSAFTDSLIHTSSIAPRSAFTDSSIQTSSITPWSCHFVDIHTAKAEGLPVNIEELKGAFNCAESWAQEFECQFLDVQATLLPYEMIAACESTEATAAVPFEFWQSALASPLVMGIDFGRRHDLTVAWTLKQVGDVQQTVEVLEMDRTPTPEQVERLRPRLRRVRRACLDYTGAGIGLGDYLVKEFGEYDPARHKLGKIELCHFSNALKLEIFSKLRMAFEKRGLRMPVNRTIREDLHSVNRVSTPSGQITYRAPHHADGHADRCTALALAVRAAGKGQVKLSIESVPRRDPAQWPWKNIREPLTPGGHPLYPWVL